LPDATVSSLFSTKRLRLTKAKIGMLKLLLNVRKLASLPRVRPPKPERAITPPARAQSSDRIFSLLDETPETDEGYVSLVNAKEENGKLTETPEHTGLWAWKHTHQVDDLVYIDAVISYLAVCYIVEAVDKVSDGSLSSSGGACPPGKRRYIYPPAS